jgi:hypothetical protein
MKFLGLFKLALPNLVGWYLWTSASKWMAPDNKFLWCPSGLHLLPTAIYIVRSPGETDAMVSYVLGMEVLNIGGVISYRYHDVASNIALQAMCEES